VDVFGDHPKSLLWSLFFHSNNSVDVVVCVNKEMFRRNISKNLMINVVAIAIVWQEVGNG